MINEKKLECIVPDSNVTFIVMSSDGYQKFWEPFIFLYKKNFPQGPKLTIFSNTIEKNIDDCQIVPLGDLAWSTRLKKALLKTQQETIIFMLEDFLIGSTVDVSKFNILIKSFKTDKYKYLKLKMNLLGTSGTDKTEKIKKNVDYQISLQPSIWDKRFLLEILPKKPSNAWETEQHFNSLIHDKKIDFSGCYSSSNNPLCIFHGAVKGELLPTAAWKLRVNGLNINPNNFKVMRSHTFAKLLLRWLIKYILPSLLYMKVKSLLKLLRIKVY